MYSRTNKIGYFVLEALNSLSTTYYFYYLYFFTEQKFGFGKLQNLGLAALLGFLYMFAAVYGGRFGQRRGYFNALKVGCLLMALAIGSGAFASSALVHVLLAMVANVAMCFTWPTLEALVSEGESPKSLQRKLGIYNLVWGGFGAVAYFTGGTLVEKTNYLGMFYVPAAILLVQLALTLWLERRARVDPGVRMDTTADELPHDERERSPVSPQTFLKMAWLANPFGYLAINTVVAVMPAVAAKLALDASQTGIFCSLWFFVRTAAFALLWAWTGWHYRFRWLASAFVGIVVSFGVILSAVNLPLLLVAQVVFGLSLGLVYYSSLYYSMDVGETKGEHGGFHEAAIGAGCFGGPAMGAAALYLFPNSPDSSTWAVVALLCCGFIGLLWLRFSRASKQHSHP
jgi:MFS family permease